MSDGLPVGILKINGDRINPATEETLAAILAATGSGTTQYTEGDTDASFTGIMMLMEDAGNTARPLQGSVADGLLVNLGTNNDVTITGTVTVQASNLDIRDLSAGSDSVAAVQSGAWSVSITGSVTEANSAAIAASLSVLDDWDESDRAKVNIIVGQAGVAAGAGAVGVTVQRMTLASDDPAVTALQIMDDWDESDRAKVNIIAGQAGVAGGSGTVSSLTQRVVLATDVGLPAGTNLLGKVGRDTTATGTTSNVSSSASNVTLLSSNSSRKGAIIYNDSLQPLKIKYGTTASATSFTTEIPPGWEWEMTGVIYTGQIDGIWDATNGSARITEL